MKKYEQEDIVKVKAAPVGTTTSVRFGPDDFYCSATGCPMCLAKVQAANVRVKKASK